MIHCDGLGMQGAIKSLGDHPLTALKHFLDFRAVAGQGMKLHELLVHVLGAVIDAKILVGIENAFGMVFCLIQMADDLPQHGQILVPQIAPFVAAPLRIRVFNQEGTGI